jgi:uncharacterized protein YndB with AHSA1/START domain
MPKQKDLKRLVRSRMTKTGESYTTARLRLVKKSEPQADYSLAGMSDDAVRKATGRTWPEWVKMLDAVQSREKSHRDIARYVASLGTPSWWTQMVTVGYERIRGLRQQRQQRDGTYEASKSRTFPVAVEVLYRAFSEARLRRKWLETEVSVKSSAVNKRMRLDWGDGTTVQVAFTAKGEAKSTVAVQHEKLADRDAVDGAKTKWAERFDRLAEMLR